MTPEQYASLNSTPAAKRVLGVADLVDKTPRTLIYGYTVARATFHVYLGADGLIHVMTYNESYSKAEPSPFLVQYHSAGEAGGLTDNAHYVPSKRVYPERCDFEFVQLLMREGVSIPFTTFPKTEGAGIADQSPAYAGRTFEQAGATLVVDVSSTLAHGATFQHLPYAERRELAYRVAYQAASDLRLAMTADESTVCVATEQVDAFWTAARALLIELPKTLPKAEYGVADDLIEHLYGKNKLAGRIDVTTESNFGGELHFEVVVQDRQPIRARSKKFTAYKCDSDDRRGVSGVFKGRPFVALQTASGSLNIRLSQFGAPERFLAQSLRLYGLSPVADPVAQAA